MQTNGQLSSSSNKRREPQLSIFWAIFCRILEQDAHSCIFTNKPLKNPMKVGRFEKPGLRVDSAPLTRYRFSQCCQSNVPASQDSLAGLRRAVSYGRISKAPQCFGRINWKSRRSSVRTRVMFRRSAIATIIVSTKSSLASEYCRRISAERA